MRSPWKAGSISLRWRMCSSPSSSSSECGPSVGRRISFASPALVRSRAGGEDRAHVVGVAEHDPRDRIDARREDVAEARALARGVRRCGRTSHSAICRQPRGSRGPGGSPDAFMNASVHSRAMPAPATATAERDPLRQHALPRRRGGRLRRQMGHRLRRGRPPSGAGQGRQGARRRAGPFGRSLEVGAGTGYFSLNMLQAGFVGDAVCTDISPGMLDALQANARRLDLDVEHRRVRRRGAAVRGRLLRPRLRPRGAAPPARPRPRLRRVPPRAAARRAALLRRRAVALRRPHRPGPQARGVPPSRRSGGGSCAPRRRPRATATAARPTTSSRPSSTSTPSPPTSSRPSPRARGAGRRPRARRGAAGQLVRVGQPRARGDRRPRHRPVGLEGLRLQGLPGLPGGRPPAARAAPAAGDLLQPHPVGAQPGWH